MTQRRSVGERVPGSRRTPALDAWVRSVQRIEDARVELLAALEELEPLILSGIDAVASGETLSQLVATRGLQRRRRISDALGDMTSALAENRAAAIRVIVDDEGHTLTDAAKLFGVPRQVLSRLYHGAG